MTTTPSGVPLIGQKPFKIHILVPSHAQVHALFAFDLANLTAFTASIIPPDEGHELGVTFSIGTYVHKSRTELLQGALAAGATQVLWLDSDMRFPKTALARLLSHRLPVVGINYAKREFPTSFVALEKVGDEGKALFTGPDSTGLAEVEGLGFGCVLMDTDVLAGLPDPAKEPWFWYAKTPGGHEWGEDTYFCKFMLRERLGLRLFVDQDLSWQCEHLGEMGFHCAHAASEMNQDALKEAVSGARN